MNTPSKATAIRTAFNELGRDATFSQIRQCLRAKKIDVTPQQVSNERRKLPVQYDLGDLPISVIKKVKTLVDEVGSTAVVRRALDELDELAARRNAR